MPEEPQPEHPPDPEAPAPTQPPLPDEPEPEEPTTVPSPAPWARSETVIPTTEPVVDMTHWPQHLRRLFEYGRRRGEQFEHEGTTYEILMGTAGDDVLVTEVGADDPKPVLVIRAPERAEEQTSG